MSINSHECMIVRDLVTVPFNQYFHIPTSLTNPQSAAFSFKLNVASINTQDGDIIHQEPIFIRLI